MRIIDVCDAPLRTVAVSPDGRFVAASADRVFGVFHWVSGEPATRRAAGGVCAQFAFAPDGRWAAYADRYGLCFDRLDQSSEVLPGLPGAFAGGVAVTPDGKALLATRVGPADQAKLDRWE